MPGLKNGHMSQFFFTQLLQSLRHRPSEDPAALRRPESDGQAAQGLGKVRGDSDFFSKMFLFFPAEVLYPKLFLTHHYAFEGYAFEKKHLVE